MTISMNLLVLHNIVYIFDTPGELKSFDVFVANLKEKKIDYII